MNSCFQDPYDLWLQLVSSTLFSRSVCFRISNLAGSAHDCCSELSSSRMKCKIQQSRALLRNFSIWLARSLLLAQEFSVDALWGLYLPYITCRPSTKVIREETMFELADCRILNYLFPAIHHVQFWL